MDFSEKLNQPTYADDKSQELLEKLMGGEEKMKWEKDLIIVTFSSIIFGLASFLFLRIPYMVWGTFDGAFAFSFVLWSCYIGMLYISIKLQSSRDKKYIQWGIKAIVLGILAAIVKMA